MKQMSIDDAVAIFEGKCGSNTKGAIDIAIEALREKQEREKPLTLNDLTEMDGEPVWIVEWNTNIQSHSGHWELSEYAGDYLEDREECFYGMTKHDSEKLHPKGWLAYRIKPLPGGKEA